MGNLLFLEDEVIKAAFFQAIAHRETSLSTPRLRQLSNGFSSKTIQRVMVSG